MFCTKRCATSQDLARHLRSHQGKAEFQCSMCPRTFVHRANFKQHQRSHLGEKPYKCLPCGRKFGLLNVLKKHHKSHIRKVSDLTKSHNFVHTAKIRFLFFLQGETTKIVTAPKGRRGCISFIDFVHDDKPVEESTLVQPFQANVKLLLSSSMMESGENDDNETIAVPMDAAASVVDNEEQPSPNPTHRPPPAYIPSGQYIQSTNRVTPLSQMRALADYGEIGPYQIGSESQHGSSSNTLMPLESSQQQQYSEQFQTGMFSILENNSLFSNRFVCISS